MHHARLFRASENICTDMGSRLCKNYERLLTARLESARFSAPGKSVKKSHAYFHRHGKRLVLTKEETSCNITLWKRPAGCGAAAMANRS